MKKLGGAIIVGLVGLVVWHVSRPPAHQGEWQDPWQELVDTLDAESDAIDAKIARWRRFKAEREDVDRALLRDELSLPKAAALVLAAARLHYPDMIDIAYLHAEQPHSRCDLTNMAQLLVYSYRLELQMHGKRCRFAPKLLERWEQDLAAMLGNRTKPSEAPSSDAAVTSAIGGTGKP
jgi:hypothetical protein